MTNKELLERLDVSQELIDKADDLTLEDFNKEYDKKWISIEAAKTNEDIINPAISAKVGEVTGAVMTAVKRGFKEQGITFDPAELKDEDGKDLHVEKIASLGFEKLGLTITELKESAGKDNDEKLKQLQSKFDTTEIERDKFRETAEANTTELTELKTSHANDLQGMHIKIAVDNARSGLSFKDGITDIEKAGLNAKIAGLKYTLEDDQVKVTDEKGEPFFNEKKTETLNLEQTFEKIAKDNKLIKENNLPDGNKRKGFDFKGQDGDGKPKGNQIHEKAREFHEANKQ